MQEKSDELFGLADASAYARVGRQAIYLAIRKGRLPATRKTKKIPNGSTRQLWVIKKSDIDAYRASKYNQDNRMVEGEKLFDIANDKWSVLHAAKTLTAVLGAGFAPSHIYYLIRTGKLKAKKKGGSWVISRESLMQIYQNQKEKEELQTTFA